MAISTHYRFQKLQSVFYYVLFITLGAFYVLLCVKAEYKTALQQSGYLSFGLFFFLLALNPLIRYFPKLPLVGYFNCFRRELGIGSFIFLCVHIYASIMNAITLSGQSFPVLALFIHPVIAPGFYASLIFLVLALTSSNWAISVLGVSRWKRWHKTAYIAQWLVFAHMLLQPVWAALTALLVGLPLFAIQKYRWRTERFLNLSPAWEGFRPLVVSEKRKEEVEGIYTFYLKDPKKKYLPAFHPGQYLTIAFDIPGMPEPVVRAYSLSNWRAKPKWYRFTVKQVLADKSLPNSQDGLVSNYLASTLQEGTILQAKAPQGHFILDPKDNKPLVLIGGGIGVTPLLSMIPSLLLTKRKREIWFFYSVKNRDFEYLREDLARIELEYPGFHRHVFYSDPAVKVEGEAYHQGRITVEHLQRLLPSLDFDFYLCGPTGMLQSLVGDLEKSGVPQHKIHYETFDPSTFIKKEGAIQESCELSFERSQVKGIWTQGDGTILQFAKKHGVRIPSNCRMGNCGACAIPVLSGSFNYAVPPTTKQAENECLACIATPKSDLRFDC